jgi:uncharacterized membrane protein
MMSQNRQAVKDRDEAEHDYEANREALEQLARLEEEQGRIRELLVDLSVRTGLQGRLVKTQGSMSPLLPPTVSSEQVPRRPAEGHVREG